MEQEFDVEIKEVLSRVQKVKAESLDDAINKAMDKSNEKARESAEKHHGNPDKDKEATPFR